MNTRELVKLAAARIALKKIAYAFGEGQAYQAPTMQDMPQDIWGNQETYAPSAGSLPSGITDTPQSVIQSAMSATPGRTSAPATPPSATDPLSQLGALMKGPTGAMVAGSIAPLLIAMLGGSIGNLFRGPDYGRQIRSTSGRIADLSNQMRNRRAIGAVRE